MFLKTDIHDKIGSLEELLAKDKITYLRIKRNSSFKAKIWDRNKGFEEYYNGTSSGEDPQAPPRSQDPTRSKQCLSYTWILETSRHKTHPALHFTRPRWAWVRRRARGLRRRAARLSASLQPHREGSQREERGRGHEGSFAGVGLGGNPAQEGEKVQLPRRSRSERETAARAGPACGHGGGTQSPGPEGEPCGHVCPGLDAVSKMKGLWDTALASKPRRAGEHLSPGTHLAGTSSPNGGEGKAEGVEQPRKSTPAGSETAAQGALGRELEGGGGGGVGEPRKAPRDRVGLAHGPIS
ncbi:uncharacterized protein LOC110741717 [Papio anubis]|uniref:uncharacterized protein LOC110741717 n=1 Tax=Papio anubis TaxID=9555 RepID=UPI0012AD609B|nr:uncharacterized protein LOC110741717 [Papio anubis]